MENETKNNAQVGAKTEPNSKQFELWKVELKKGEEIIKFDEGTYKVLFKGDGEIIDGQYGKQVLLHIEGWDVVTEQQFAGVWYVPFSDYENSLYGQLQKFRGDIPLSGRMITLKVVGTGTTKRYKIVDLG